MIDKQKSLTENSQGEVVIYQSKTGGTKIDVRFAGETVWLTQAQLCDLYQTSKANISEHIKHIFEEGELDESSVVRKFRTTATDGKSYNVAFYNLDMIISLGYRVKSIVATHFRRWATERLKEYMIKGFTMDDDRLKNLGGGDYWHELFIEFIGLWECLHNPDFKRLEFEGVKTQAGANAFTMAPQKWIKKYKCGWHAFVA